MGLFAVIGLLWLGWLIGWHHAHHTVAAECERLGGFFVGEQIYKCVAVEPKLKATLDQEPIE